MTRRRCAPPGRWPAATVPGPGTHHRHPEGQPSQAVPCKGLQRSGLVSRLGAGRPCDLQGNPVVGRWPSRAWTAPDGHLLSGPAWACEHRIMRYAMSSGGVTFPKLVGHGVRASFAAKSVASSSASPRPAAAVPRPSRWPGELRLGAGSGQPCRVQRVVQRHLVLQVHQDPVARLVTACCR